MPETGATNWPAADTFQAPAAPTTTPQSTGGDTTRALHKLLADIGAAWEAMRTDSRWTNGRAPTGTAGGDLTGTYPNPTVAALAITDAKVAAANKDGATGTASMRTLGTGAQQAAPGDKGPSALLTTKGDALVFGSAPTRLPVGTDGQTLRADSTATTGLAWKDRDRILAESHTDVTVVNSVAATTLATLTIPANAMAVGDRVHLHAVFELLNNQAGSNGATIDVKLGGTTIGLMGSIGYAQSANKRCLLLDTWITLVAAGSQEGDTELRAYQPAAAGSFGGSLNLYALYNTGAKDMTASQDVTVVGTLGVADANFSLTLHNAFLEIKKK